MKLRESREILDLADHVPIVRFDKVSRKTASGRHVDMLLHDGLAFSADEYVRRYELVQNAMAAQGLDALLIRGPENITWFTGFETPGYYRYLCVVLPRDGQPVFLVRDFEWLNTPEFAWVTKIVKVYDWDHAPSVTADVLNSLGFSAKKRIGVEKQCFFYTVDEHDTLTKDLPQSEFVDATQIMWDARMIKSQEEITVMRKSAALVDKAMLAGFEATRAGASGDHINAVVNATLFEGGGEYMGLPPFVLAGPRSCLPHQTGGANLLETNDLMYFEISASTRRYAAALMRTIFIGKPREEWLRAAHACIDSVEAALAFIKPGVTAHDADTVARQVTTKAGFSEFHRNRLGYCIGVNYPPDWGEGEIISLRQGEERELRPGMTFHMPPLCLKYREFGIGFSETIVVTDKGCERLSTLPREIIIK
jgi:Xaa-Pro dipeptidase